MKAPPGEAVHGGRWGSRRGPDGPIREAPRGAGPGAGAAQEESPGHLLRVGLRGASVVRPALERAFRPGGAARTPKGGGRGGREWGGGVRLLLRRPASPRRGARKRRRAVGA